MFVNPECCSPPFPEWRKSRLDQAENLDDEENHDNGPYQTET